MKYGFVLEGGEPRHVANLAAEAEAAGWDAVFVADAVAIETPSYPTMPWYNSWVMLAAIAEGTSFIRDWLPAGDTLATLTAVQAQENSSLQ